ncbi:MarR family winged helix-turn-helix transcriptional regulator [Micropruina sp.]|uniref:MarR family winged helix-turn-helix transcriptional regulator n=1 Tax=Micropruina sp. TaxID=2737536 RepID=UPI0039E2A219
MALRRLNSALTISNRVVSAQLGLKDSDLAVLDCLDQEGPQTPTALARRTHTHVATMTGILTRLERDGWIERRPVGTDRRSVEIHATGVQRLTETYAQTNEQLTALLASWSPEQMEALLIFLTRASEIGSEFSARLGGVPAPGLESGT